MSYPLDISYSSSSSYLPHYPPSNAMYPNPQLTCARLLPFNEPFPANNGYDEQCLVELPPNPMCSVQVVPTTLASQMCPPPIYAPTVTTNGIIPPNSVTPFLAARESGLMMNPTNVTYYPNPFLSYMPQMANFATTSCMPIVNYPNGGNTFVLNQPQVCGSEMANSINIEILQSARKWIGELYEPCTDNISHYQCRFEIETDKFRPLVEDLKKIFRSKIDITNDIPGCNSTTQVSFAYFKVADFAEFNKYYNPKLQECILPGRQLHGSFKVSVRALSLPEGLYCGRDFHHNNRSNNFRHEYQLYVEGLERMFVAQDLLKIYEDLYKCVNSVRVFSDKNGYPNKSALINFYKKESFEKALTETPITVKSSNLTVHLRHKIYERSRPRHFNSNSSNYNNINGRTFNFGLNGKTHYPKSGFYRNRESQHKPIDYNSANYSTSNYRRADNNKRFFGNAGTFPEIKQHSLTFEAKSRINFSGEKIPQQPQQPKCTTSHQLERIRKEAIHGNSVQYIKMKQDLAVYNKLQYQNYLSD